MAGGRTAFSEDDDSLLVKYIAKYNPGKTGRQGNALYQRLEVNKEGKWKWAARHPWQSWRERYKNQQPWFDQEIKAYQQRKGIKSENLKQKVVVRKKAARRRDAVEESLTEQEEEDQLQKSESERDRDAERKRKRKRIEEKEDRKRKKAKKEEEEASAEEADAIEISTDKEGQVRPQNNSRASSEPRHGESDEEDSESEGEGKGPAGPDDYSAEIFGGAEADEIVEDSENVGPEGDGDTSQDEVGVDEEMDGIVIGGARDGSGSPDKDAASPSRQATMSPRKSIIPGHSAPKGGGPLYPDLSVLPSPIVSNPNNEERQLPGAFHSPIKHEPPTQDNIAPEASSHNLHPSQEPTPPGSQERSSREPVFPGGNHKAGLPMRTNTLVLRDPSSRSDTNTPEKSDVPTKSKLKLKRRRRSSANESDKSDFFESISPTPGHNRDVRMAREPPQLVDGPFGNAFTDGRRRAQRHANGLDCSEDEDDEDKEVIRNGEQEWPPRRTFNKQTDTKGKGKAKDDGWVPALLLKAPAPATAGSSSRGVQLKPQGDHHPFTQPTQEYENVMAQYFGPNGTAEASSSETPHDTHHPFSQPSQAVGWHDSTTNYIMTTVHTPMEPRKHHRAFIESLPDADRTTAGSTDTKIADSNAKRVYVPLSRVAPFLGPEVPRRRHGSDGKGKDTPRVPNGDRKRRRIFMSARQSLPAQRPVARIEELVPSRRASAPVEDPRASSSVSSTPSNMSTTDRSIAMRLGVDAMLQKMSDNHGFTLDVIKRLYNVIGDFQRTDAALMRMRESAEMEATSYIDMDVNQVDKRSRTSQHSSPRRISYPFPGLEYTPVNYSSGNLSDYSPPETSRAARYTRLAKQGRRLEALKREGRAVSFGRTGDFLRHIRMSEPRFSRATPGALVGSVDGQSPESALASVDHNHDIAVDMASPSPQQPIWGEEEDRLLRSGDLIVLKDLEARMGKASFKRRTAEIHSAPV